MSRIDSTSVVIMNKKQAGAEVQSAESRHFVAPAPGIRKAYPDGCSEIAPAKDLFASFPYYVSVFVSGVDKAP